MDEIVSSLAETVIPVAIDWARAKIRDSSKQRRIKRLIEETKTRAALVPSSFALFARFNNNHAVEELLAHHALVDKTKSEAISTFLGDEADEAAIDFVADFYDSVTEIKATADDSLATRRTLEGVEQLQEQVDALSRQISSDTREEVGQIALLEEFVRFIAAGKINLDQIEDLIESSEGTFASLYLQGYKALCMEGELDVSTLDRISGNDTLVFALASVAVSAGRFAEAIEILKLCSFDVTSIVAALEKMFMDGAPLETSVEIEAPESDGAKAFVELMNFEYYCRLKAYSPSMGHIMEKEIIWNPLAKEKLLLIELTSAAFYDKESLTSLANEVIGLFRPSFPGQLVQRFKDVFSLVLSRFNSQSAESLIASFPDELEYFAQNERTRLMIRTSEDADELFQLFEFAENHKDCVLLLEVACKLIAVDESARPEIIRGYRRCKDWVFPTGGALLLYVKEIDPTITYEQFCNYGEGKEWDSSFHLAAYEVFREREFSKAEMHIEKAIEIMRSKSGAPDLHYARIWVPYLVERGRSEEVRRLVEKVLPVAPPDNVLSFMSAIANCEDAEPLFEYFIDPLVNSDFYDARSAEIIARELAVRRHDELAGRMALAAFKKRPTETLAILAVQWLDGSCLEIDDSIVQFAKRQDTPQMNLLLAQVAHGRNKHQKANSYLLRAASDDCEAASRALALYAGWNIENGKEIQEHNAVAPDTYVKLSTGEDRETTFLFPSDPEAVKQEGSEGPAGIVFSTSSTLFLRMRGMENGHVLESEGRCHTVIDVGPIERILIRKGLEKMAELPGGMVLTGTPEETITKLVEMMKASPSWIDLYQQGIELEHGKIFYGIETGADIARLPQLEFMIGVICDPEAAYRKNPISRNAPISQDDTFLLSYNAVVVLALLGLPDDAIAKLRERCFVTESTIKRLNKDVQNMVNTPYRSAGRLGFDGENLLLAEYSDGAKQQILEKGLAVANTVELLNVATPSAQKADINLNGILSDNEIIDIQTASEQRHVYVTEDILESQVIDACDSVRRCSVALMLIGLEAQGYVLRDYASQMATWGVEPVLEQDIVEAASEIFNDILAELYVANVNVDVSLEESEDS